MVQICLHIIAFMPKFSIMQLQNAISAPELIGDVVDESSMISEDEIARRCSSLIRKSKDGKRFEFAHFTVKEFLKDKELLSVSGLEKFHLEKEKGDIMVATQSLRFLLSKTFARCPTTLDSESWIIHERDTAYPFYPQAALKWTECARDHLDDPTIWELALLLFSPAKSAIFQAWATEFVLLQTFNHYSEDADPEYLWEKAPNDGTYIRRAHVRLIETIIDPRFLPLHFAAMLSLPKICDALIKSGSNFELACGWGTPLQLAVASLTPFLSRLYISNYYEDEIWYDGSKLEKDLDKTIDVLMKAGAPLNPAHDESSLLDPAFDIASIAQGFSVAEKLLLAGVMPRRTSPKSFRDCLEVWNVKFVEHYIDPEYHIYPMNRLHDFLGHINQYLEDQAPHDWDEYPEGHTIHLLYKIVRIGYLFLLKYSQMDEEEMEGFASVWDL